MYQHTEHPEDHTEHEVGVIVGYTDPHETTGSDAETTPLETIWVPVINRRRDMRPIASRHEKWRMYRRTLPNGDTEWVAYQPDHVDEPMFPAPKGDKYAATAGGLYARRSASGLEVLELFQLAIAKAEAAAHLDQALRNAKAAA